ncbi:hypothetical protein [Methyloraptor flagellatus]|uniref:Glycosyltransferase n=1 Tax=Methyloraptor flagellatus TaxID=3162530 RepID=A0AAU7XAE0_9HYPH
MSERTKDSDGRRFSIGLWSEIPAGGRWANEGISRMLGFLIEGAAKTHKYKFCVCVSNGLGRVVRDDFSALAAVEYIDWEVFETPDRVALQTTTEQRDLISKFGLVDGLVQQALYANQSVPVDAWIIPHPHFTTAVLLDKPRATLVADAIPFDFSVAWRGTHYFGDNGHWTRWQRNVSAALATSDVVVTHSMHNALKALIELLNCPPERLIILPNAAVDIIESLPWLKERRRTTETRLRAHAIVREYFHQHGPAYLADFPFEEHDYLVISTRDRPQKNIVKIVEAVATLNRKKNRNLKIITTAHIEHGEWTRLPDFISGERYHLDFISTPDLPRDVHAALYHGSVMSIHSSFFEGGTGGFPFFESNSVGVPGAQAFGPHVDELLDYMPTIRPYCFDPYDTNDVIRAIELVLDHREEALQIQSEAYQRHSSVYDWTHVVNAWGRALFGETAAGPFFAGPTAGIFGAYSFAEEMARQKADGAALEPDRFNGNAA